MASRRLRHQQAGQGDTSARDGLIRDLRRVRLSGIETRRTV
ncbi:hypothetical protein FHR81_004505 [Actinoalloteichus hoggarensis]|nr:hypothetical protein [Actinoalloteichus hoggarensis]MBB5923434.1 hypothetical protein [Actinoalloteichus hoggarensis]